MALPSVFPIHLKSIDQFILHEQSKITRKIRISHQHLEQEIQIKKNPKQTR